jgi:hypothetical protein
VIFFDSCTFHAPQEAEKEAMCGLLKFKEEGIIVGIISYKVDRELSRAPSRIARKRVYKIYTIPLNLTEEEREIKTEIRRLLFSDRQSLKTNEMNDVDNVFEAQKYGCRYFVTLDNKHILSKGKYIKKRFHLIVVTPSECLREIKEYIEQEE